MSCRHPEYHLTLLAAQQEVHLASKKPTAVIPRCSLPGTRPDLDSLRKSRSVKQKTQVVGGVVRGDMQWAKLKSRVTHDR